MPHKKTDTAGDSDRLNRRNENNDLPKIAWKKLDAALRRQNWSSHIKINVKMPTCPAQLLGGYLEETNACINTCET